MKNGLKSVSEGAAATTILPIAMRKQNNKALGRFPILSIKIPLAIF
jgi:hypothetical protein